MKRVRDRTPWLPLYWLVLGVSCALGGFYLSVYEAGIFVWGLTSLLLLYLAATGQGGILLATSFYTGILGTFTLRYPWPRLLLPGVALFPAQIWALTLLLLWGLGILLILMLAFLAEQGRDRGWRLWQRLSWLGGTSLLIMLASKAGFHYLFSQTFPHL